MKLYVYKVYLLRKLNELKFELQTVWYRLTNPFRKQKVIIDREYIHSYFGLSYAHYIVLPRTLLQSMPDGWQKRFIRLMDEFEDRFSSFEWLPEGTYYNVSLKDEKGKIVSIKEDIFNDYDRGRRKVKSFKGDYTGGKE